MAQRGFLVRGRTTMPILRLQHCTWICNALFKLYDALKRNDEAVGETHIESSRPVLTMTPRGDHVTVFQIEFVLAICQANCFSECFHWQLTRGTPLLCIVQDTYTNPRPTHDVEWKVMHSHVYVSAHRQTAGVANKTHVFVDRVQLSNIDPSAIGVHIGPPSPVATSPSTCEPSDSFVGPDESSKPFVPPSVE